MAKLFNFQQFLTRKAVKTAQFKPIAQEWEVTIYVLFILKILLSCVSIAAGFNYLQMVTHQIVGYAWLSRLNAGLFLIVLELLTWTFLEKFWKFSLRGRKATATAVATFVVLLFGLSFHVSTQGIARFTSDVVDNSTEIKAKHNAQIEAVSNDYQASINANKEQIASIRRNPAGWQGGKRTILTAEQLESINSLINKNMELKQAREKRLTHIRGQMKADLKANAANQTSQAGKYYMIVAILLGIMFVAHGGLMFFWVAIYRETESLTAEIEESAKAAEAISEQMKAHAHSTMERVQQQMLEAMETHFTRNEYSLPQNSKAESIQKKSSPSSENTTPGNGNERKIGFQMPASSENRPDVNPNGMHLNLNTSQGTKKATNPPDNLHVLLKEYEVPENENGYLKKYERIADAIIERANHPNNKPTLTQIARRNRRSIGTVYNVKRIVDQYISGKEAGNVQS